MNKKNKNLILSIFAVLTVVLITGGVTYAFFTYTGEGNTDNIITTGSITFLYTEVDGVGNGIKLENAFPKSDDLGKVSTKTNEYFDFKITSGTTSTTSIPYEVTARKSSDSDDIDEYVRLYLTKGETEEVLLKNYSELTQTSKVDSSKYTERTIYTGKVPANNPNFEESFRLRMWLREGTRFENEQMNNKTFTVNINVYANAKVVTNEEIALENSAKINVLSIDDTELTKVENEAYDYETTLPEDTTSTTINIETENPNAKVTVEKVDSLAKSNNVKRLATTKTLELTNGENYFKVTVTSENKQVENEFKIRIYVGQEGIALGDAILNKYPVIEKTPTLTTTSAEANENGLYKSTLTNSGNPTYYFRGNVENYIDFAGFTWRVVRINEDGTIRIVMQNGINDDTVYNFNPIRSDYTYMYYSNSNVENGAKYILDNWYQTNIVGKGYDSNVVEDDYFCEEAKVKSSSDYTSGDVVMKLYSDPTYEPTFKCSVDGNVKGIVNESVGLLTYDESLFAGAYFEKDNSNYYLYNNTRFWIMSPAGFYLNYNAHVWHISDNGSLILNSVQNTYALRPVINLKADTVVTGTGDSTNHWVVAN